MKNSIAVILVACITSIAIAQQNEVSAKKSGHEMHKARPQLATGAAFAPDGRLWIVGLNENLQLFVQSSSSEKLGDWEPQKILNTTGDAISADGENRPKIAFGPNGWVVISYTQPLAKPYTGFIRMLRSDDGGNTFSSPFTVHQDQQEITHRFESIAFDNKGSLHTLWVDKRDQPPRNSGKTYVGAAIYRNVSVDGGATFGPDLKVADHSCECCRIALAPDADGNLQAMWRHVFGEQTRDHAFANFMVNNANDITRSTFDEWQINACPHHGPGLAINNIDKHVGYHSVWFGIRKLKDQSVASAWYSKLNLNGSPIPESVIALPDERAEHADVMAQGKNVAVVWRSSEGMKTTLRAWLSRDGGKRFEIKNIAETNGYNDHPRLVQSNQRMAIVWRLPKGAQVYEIKF